MPYHEHALPIPQLLLVVHDVSPFVAAYNFMSIPSCDSSYAVGDSDGTREMDGD